MKPELAAAISAASQKAGWSVQEYAPLVSLGRTTLLTLPVAMRPFSTKVGRRRVIHEPPPEYLRRIGGMQRSEA